MSRRMGCEAREDTAVSRSMHPFFRSSKEVGTGLGSPSLTRLVNEGGRRAHLLRGIEARQYEHDAHAILRAAAERAAARRRECRARG